MAEPTFDQEVIKNDYATAAVRRRAVEPSPPRLSPGKNNSRAVLTSVESESGDRSPHSKFLEVLAKFLGECQLLSVSERLTHVAASLRDAGYGMSTLVRHSEAELRVEIRKSPPVAKPLEGKI